MPKTFYSSAAFLTSIMHAKYTGSGSFSVSISQGTKGDVGISGEQGIPGPPVMHSFMFYCRIAMLNPHIAFTVYRVDITLSFLSLYCRVHRG